MKKFFIKRSLFIVPGVIAYLVTLYAQYDTDWTEYVYSQTIYPALSTVVAFLPALVRFSVAEWSVVLFILFCLGYIIFYIRKLIKHKTASSSSKNEDKARPKNKDSRPMIAYRGAVGLVAIVCIVYFSFTALCGLNYYRHTFTDQAGYTIEESSAKELEQLCLSLSEDLVKAREQLGENINPYTLDSGDFDYYAQHSVQAMQTLATQYPVLDRSLYSAPKPVLVSELMSNAGIGGIFFPFTMESNINTYPPAFTLPSTMAHELAHQCGFMREDEANFIAYLACKQSDDPLMRYSGLYLAFSHSISALAETEPERASEILSELSPAVQRDRRQNRQFWSQHEGVLTDISRDTNDAYLRANNQTDGVQSYGRMVELLLAEQRASAS